MSEDNVIFLTLNKLMDFARFAADWNDIAADCGCDPMADCEFEGSYALSLNDVKEALEYVRDSRITIDKFLMGWWFPLVLKCDEALMIRDIFTGVIPHAGIMEPALPMTDDDMLVYVLDLLADFSNSEEGRYSSALVTDYLDIELILDEIEMYEEDNQLPVTERRFSERMREKFIMQLDNDMLLGDSDEDTRQLWKKFTDELAQTGNFNAMRIKAYACYGGNCVYECDWAESARLLEKLWRDFSFGQAANTLGYIYYYGRLDPAGKPDYEKAFFYFSIGSTYGIVESKYKLADMFVNGQYVARNERLARSLVGELYGETRTSFENGYFDCDFADVAYRMGKLFRDISVGELDPASRKGALEVAKVYLLQARFAIDLRMQNNYAYGDDRVKNNIESVLGEVSQFLPTAKGNVYHSFNPIFASLFTDNRAGTTFNVSVRKYKNGNIGFKVSRNIPGGSYDVPYTMVVLPWFNQCAFTDHISFSLSGISEFSCPRGQEHESFDITIDTITSSESEYEDCFSLQFFRNGELLIKASASEIIYRKLSNARPHIPEDT